MFEILELILQFRSFFRVFPKIHQKNQFFELFNPKKIYLKRISHNFRRFINLMIGVINTKRQSRQIARKIHFPECAPHLNP